VFGLFKKTEDNTPAIPQVDWHVIPDKYASLVDALEKKAHDDPDGYRRKLMGVAFLGYGYLFLVLSVVLGLIAGLVAIIVMKPGGAGVLLAKKAGIPLVILAYVVITALWVKLDAPDYGEELTEKEAPDLFAFLKELKARVNGPDIYKVYLTDELNASIIQHTPYGIFGGHRNYLFLGLRLMEVIPPEQLKAVVAHEYGHIVGDDGRFGNWIFRVRETWANVANKMFLEEKFGGFIFKKFFSWYVPYFNAYSFVLARKQEFLADAFAADVVTPEAVGQSLVTIRIRGYEMNYRFFDQYWSAAQSQAKPQDNMYVALTKYWANSRDADVWSNVLQNSLEHDTGLDDTHPSLARRLQAVGVTPKLPDVCPSPNAAEFFLQDGIAAYRNKFSEEWWAYAEPHWTEKFQYAEQGRTRLVELAQAYQENPNMEWRDKIEYADLLTWLKTDEEAEPLYREVLKDNPSQGWANMELGMILLRRRDKTGLDFLKETIKVDEGNVIAVYDRAGQMLWDMGFEEEVKFYAELAHKRRELEAKAEEEREYLRLSDQFEPHQLPAEEIAALVEKMKPLTLITDAFLVRKKCKYLADKRPLYVIGVLVEPLEAKAIKKNGSSVSNEILEKNIFTGHEYFAVNLSDKTNKKLKQSIEAVEDAKIY